MTINVLATINVIIINHKCNNQLCRSNRGLRNKHCAFFSIRFRLFYIVYASDYFWDFNTLQKTGTFTSFRINGLCLTDVTREILNLYIFVLPLETYGNSEQNYIFRFQKMLIIRNILLYDSESGNESLLVYTKYASFLLSSSSFLKLTKNFTFMHFFQTVFRYYNQFSHRIGL